MGISSTAERAGLKMDTDSYFNKIYAETSAQLLRYVVIKTSNADQVEDILQNVYRDFYERIRKKGFSDIKSPGAFLGALAKRELARHYKRKAATLERERDFEDCGEMVEADGVDFDELMERKDLMRQIGGLIKKLPLVSYKTFVLYYFYDMPVAEIARSLGISESNVKDRLWRARNAVRKAIKGDMQ